MKVSEVTPETVKKYIGLSSNDADDIVSIVMSASLSFVKGYTGLDDTALDTHEDITAAYLILCNDMYSNRDYVAENSEINPTALQILSQYCTNLLPSVESEASV